MTSPVATEKEVPPSHPPIWLTTMLDQRDVPYEIINHNHGITAAETAADTGARRLEFAKTVILEADGATVMAVLPAHHVVDTKLLAAALHARCVELVSNERLRELFPSCEIGAHPPFGGHYAMPVVLSVAMAMDEHITFNAGSHSTAIRMPFADYQSIVQPRILNFSVKHQTH